ncbi:hypothetical protein K0M31_018167 [Melipona bicolor]|uniref:Discoidin domain-containing protein n=1 Tax=Melipona bicolor TaxID=60889 RepID=A0AA40FD27_9HYME|nr:hypothetical protein K0M31_018167 [Melipona bicolor]
MFEGTGWVAWMRDTFVDDYVELVFEFEVAWIFEAVHIYTNNYFSRDVQVFSKADVWFSVDGATYEEEPLSYSYIPDIVLENARNVSIGLHEHHGRFVKMHLYFAGRWIMISEVTFEGTNPYENTTEESASEFSNREIPMNPEVDLNLQTSK